MDYSNFDNRATKTEIITELAYRMLRDLEDGIYDKTTNCVCNGALDVVQSAALQEFKRKLERL